MQSASFIFVLVCVNIGLSLAEDESKIPEVKNSEFNENESNVSSSSDVESRFFDLSGIFNQLFPGINQGGAGRYPRLNSPSNSQFYPGVSNQNWNPQTPINQGNGWYPNQQNIGRPPFQSQGSPSDNNFNQQGSINNINQPEQYLNQGLGQNPANLNGNQINGGGNQMRQPGNLQNSNFQGQPPQLGGQQGQGRPNYDINGFEYPGRQEAYPNQGPSNFNSNSPSCNGRPGNSFNPLNQIPQDQIPQTQIPQSNQGQGSMNNGPNQYPGKVRNPNNNFPQNSNNNQPNDQNGFQEDQRPQNGNNQLQNSGQGRPNQNNMNPNNVNQNNQLPNGQPQGAQFNPGDGGIRFPDNDYDYDVIGQPVTITNASPTTESPGIGIGNAIVGKPVQVPTTNVPDGQINFVNSDVTTASQKECVQNCPTSSEYNPVCGTDNVLYFNPGRLLCARNCGIKVFEALPGNCNRS